MDSRVHDFCRLPGKRPVAAAALCSALAQLALLLLPGDAQAAAVACTPQAGYTNCIRYTYSGAAQTFTVPVGVTSLRTTMWGAGGGGSAAASGNSAGGASGGFADGTVTVTAGSNLTVTVGQGGIAAGTTATYGRGGAGAPGRNHDPAANPQSNGSSGGGMSALWNGAEFTALNALLIAGGGGGSAFWTDQPAAPRALAGAGGGSSGVNATSTYGGQGGTQLVGGAAGGPVASCYNPVGVNSTGLQFRGGDGCWPTIAGGTPFEYEGGGGGGGGWFGGGGGTGQNDNNPVLPTNGYDGPGGGGSGYFSATAVTGGVLTAGNAPTYTVGSFAQPPQTGHALYSATIGRGGAAATSVGAAAGNGEVIIQWVAPPTTDLLLTKTNTFSSGATDLSGDTVASGAPTTYTIVVRNNGSTAVTNAILRDAAATRLGLTCAAPATCTGAACPSGSISLASLDSGVALGSLAAGGSITVTLSCTVN